MRRENYRSTSWISNMTDKTYHFSVTMPESDFITLRERLHRDYSEVRVYRDRAFTEAEEMSVDQHSDSVAELIPPERANE